MEMAQVNNMTDREILISLADRFEQFITDTRDYRNRETTRIERLESRPCPAAMCADHAARLVFLETSKKEEQSNANRQLKIDDLLWIKIGVMVSIAVAIISILIKVL